jgi:hypothetical protein
MGAPRGISALMSAMAADVLAEGVRRRREADAKVAGLDDAKVPARVKVPPARVPAWKRGATKATKEAK